MYIKRTIDNATTLAAAGKNKRTENNSVTEYRKKCIMIYLGIFLYVGIGTLSVCSLYPQNTLWSGDWIVSVIISVFCFDI